jgi:biotin operon repressor
MTYSIPARQIRIIYEQFLKGPVNKRELARALKISRNTVKNNLSKLKLFSAQFPHEISNVNGYITFVQPKRKLTEQYLFLQVLFPSVFDSIVNSNSN